MFPLLAILTIAAAVEEDLFDLSIEKSFDPFDLPLDSEKTYEPFAYPVETEKKYEPFALPLVSPEPEKEKEIEELMKALSLDKFLEKEITFEKGSALGLELTKELELEGIAKEFGLAKTFGFEKKATSPFQIYNKYLGLGKRLSFLQALALELYKEYGFYGLIIARELQRRFLIAKELGLFGKEIELKEAVSLGLFRGLGLKKIFESVNAAIGPERLFLQPGFGFFPLF